MNNFLELPSGIIISKRDLIMVDWSDEEETWFLVMRDYANSVLPVIDQEDYDFISGLVKAC